MTLKFVLRHVLGLVLVLSLLIGSSATARAQSPEASPTTDDSGPVLGDAVVIFNNSGDELAQVAVNQVLDPFEEAGDADRGFHWVAVEYVVQNTGDSDLELDPYRMQIVDEEGFGSSPGFASSDLAEQEIDPSAVPAGETVSGFLYYQLIDDSVPALVAYVDLFSDGQFVVLADLASAVAAVGDETVIYNENLDELGAVTIDEVIPEFSEVDAEIDVERGATVVGVALTIENTGDSDLDPNAYALYVVDEFGFNYSRSFLSRGDDSLDEYPDLENAEIPAGETVSGVLLYELPSDATASYIVYSPESPLLYVLAQPGDGSVVSGETLESTSGSGTDDVTPDDSASAETGDCVGVAVWVEDANGLVGPLADSLDFLGADLASVDPDDLRDGADDINDILDDADDLEVPIAAQESHDALVALLDVFATTFNDIADRLEDGVSADDIQADLGAPDSDFSTALEDTTVAVDELTETCPDSNVDALGL